MTAERDRPGHDSHVSVYDLDFQQSGRKVDRNSGGSDEASFQCRIGGDACAGSACLGQYARTLPDGEPQCPPVQNLGGVHINALGKEGVVLHHRRMVSHVKEFEAIDEEDSVRVAYIEREAVLQWSALYGQVKRIYLSGKGNPAPVHADWPKRDADLHWPCSPAVKDTCFCFNLHLVLAGLLEKKIRNAARGIAACTDFLAVYVKDSHRRVGTDVAPLVRGWFDGEQLLASRTGVAIADADDVLVIERLRPVAPIYNHKIVL